MPSPPFAIVLTVTFLLILFCFLFHTNWNTVFCNASTRLSGGFGNKIHRWIILDKISDFRTATLPSGVICLFNHTLYKAFISKNFSRKLSSSHPFQLLVNQIPCILNLGGFQSICKFGIYLMGEFLLLPSHIALVFPAFKKRPDLFPNVLIILTVSSNKFLSLSNIISVLSAYCEILCSVSPIKIPLIFLFCLNHSSKNFYA